MPFHLYNINDEERFGNNVYLIHRPYILSNPYTHIKDKKTKAMFVVSSKEEAIKKYSHYFDLMYGRNIEFTKLIDEIYQKYCNGEEIYLGCYCHPQPCHGEVIINKLQRKYIKEKLKLIKREKNI